MKNNKIQPISFIIPLHNEEDFLVGEISRLKKIISDVKINKYEMILVENGSVDNTYRLAKQLFLKDKNIKVLKISLPHYGLAIKKGLESSQFDPIIQLDLDLIDKKFIKKAVDMLGDYDILVGSKYLGKVDNRLIFRKILSFGLKKTINLLFNYYGTDTHGVKAYIKQKVINLMKNLPLTKHMFDTSIVIEAENNGLTVIETPINVKEIRSSRFPSIIRIFEAIIDIFVLFNFRLSKSAKIKFSFKFPIPFI